VPTEWLRGAWQELRKVSVDHKDKPPKWLVKAHRAAAADDGDRALIRVSNDVGGGVSHETDDRLSQNVSGGDDEVSPQATSAQQQQQQQQLGRCPSAAEMKGVVFPSPHGITLAPPRM
jgi:hypothetical protein